jgi:hypothetical protein
MDIAAGPPVEVAVTDAVPLPVLEAKREAVLGPPATPQTAATVASVVEFAVKEAVPDGPMVIAALPPVVFVKVREAAVGPAVRIVEFPAVPETDTDPAPLVLDTFISAAPEVLETFTSERPVDRRLTVALAAPVILADAAPAPELTANEPAALPVAGILRLAEPSTAGVIVAGD